MTSYITESRLISLNSQFGIQNNSSFLSDIAFELPKLLVVDKTITNVELALIHAEIPVSFYTINYTNNLFYIDTLQYDIPVGNYNATSLISTIKALIVSTHPNITITLNKITGKLTFINDFDFTINNTSNYPYSVGTILGVPENTDLTSLSNELTLTYPLNLLGIKRLSIVSNEIGTFNFTSRGNVNLLASIPIDESSYGLVIYENKNQLKHTLHLQDINKMDIQILDEQFNLVNFNNQNWTMLFSIYITRKIVDLDFGNNLGVSQPILSDSNESPTDVSLNSNPSLEPKKQQKSVELPFSENDLLFI